MPSYVLYNGDFVNENTFHINSFDRSHRYGDGFFETIKCVKCKPLWMEHHFNRMKLASNRLKIKLNTNLHKIEDNIINLLEKNQLTGTARIRINITRCAGGYYNPESENSNILIEASSIDSPLYFELSRNGVLIDIYQEIRKDNSYLGNLKTNNALVYILASLHARHNGLDDSIILNSGGAVCEATSSNLFMVSEEKLYTPGLDQNCVMGIMREVVLNIAREEKIKTHVCELFPDDLLQADEIFLTNSIRGIQWVKGFKQKRYFHKFAEKIINLLNKKIDNDYFT